MARRIEPTDEGARAEHPRSESPFRRAGSGHGSVSGVASGRISRDDAATALPESGPEPQPPEELAASDEPLRPGSAPERFGVHTRAAGAGVATRDRVFTVGLIVADVVALALALALAALVGASPSLGAVALAAAIVVAAGGAGLYDRDELLLRKTTLEEGPRLLAVAGLVTLVALLSEAVTFAAHLGTGEVLVLWSGLTMALVITRTAARHALETRVPVERCLLFGSPKDQERLDRALSGNRSPSQLVARVPVERIMSETADGECEVNLRALAGLVRWFDAQRIIISAEHAAPGTTLDLLRASKAVGVRLSFLSVVLGAIGHGLVVDDVYGIPLVGVRRFRLRRRQQLLKRAFDVVVGTVVLVLLLPALIAVAVAIRLDSAGPVLFRQRRVGRDGLPFEIVKFRTMVCDAEERKARLRAANESSGLFKIDDDPRITRLGRLLRKTSIDELPQLLNVLQGDMSLVGPRPLVLDEDEKIVGYDRRRLHLTPGMTGHWQILGSARVPLEEMLRIDYRYVTGWTLWEDVKILLRTVPYVLARRGQ